MRLRIKPLRGLPQCNCHLRQLRVSSCYGRVSPDRVRPLSAQSILVRPHQLHWWELNPHSQTFALTQRGCDIVSVTVPRFRHSADGGGGGYCPHVLALQSIDRITIIGFSDLSGEPGSLPYHCYAPSNAKADAKPIDTRDVRIIWHTAFRVSTTQQGVGTA